MESSDKIKKVLVTGGAGFLGKAIIQELLDRDSPVKPVEIRVFDLKKLSPDEHPFNGPMDDALKDPRIISIVGDIRNYSEVREATKGIDLVIHAAAIVDWGTHSEQEVLEVNVDGTENIIEACISNKIPYLVYTSSLDAVYAGEPLIDIDESIPYPEKHVTMYCRSKYLAEKRVLEANSSQLRTCALRPADIYGEGDPYHIGSLINMAKTGFYVRLGDGKARCQHVYVGNMAYAHLQAAEAMTRDNSRVCGNVYFITDGPGFNFFSFFDKIVMQAGYPIWPRNLWLPRRFAWFLGSISEMIAYLLRPIKHYNPKLSRFAVTYTCTDFTFSSERARNDFGFTPKYSEEDALKRTIEFYRKSGKE